MTVVYLDRVVLLNLAVDYLLLLATARLAGLPLRRGRLALAAALGALYAAAVFLPGCRMLAHPACRLAAGVAVCRLARDGVPAARPDGAVFSAVRGAGGAAAGGRSGGRVPGGHSQPGILRRHQLAGAAGLRHRLWAAAAPGVPPGGAA